MGQKLKSVKSCIKLKKVIGYNNVIAQDYITQFNEQVHADFALW